MARAKKGVKYVKFWDQNFLFNFHHKYNIGKVKKSEDIVGIEKFKKSQFEKDSGTYCLPPGSDRVERAYTVFLFFFR